MKFNLPSSNGVSALTVMELMGVDFWNSPENVSINRSPNCVNMIRDQSGSLRKRMGYRRLTPLSLGGRINGGIAFGTKHLIHSGEKLFIVDESGEAVLIYNGLSDQKSLLIRRSEGVFLISEGNHLFVSNDGECSKLSSKAYVPTVIVSKSPSGGGTIHEDYNLLSKTWKEQFLSDGESKTYKLEKSNITDVISVKIMDENGDLVLMDRTEYTVYSEIGEVVFTNAPEKPHVMGMDNVIIEVSKEDEWENNVKMLFGCTVGTVYGVQGKNDRLFIGGNPEYAGMDFFSAPENFFYFPLMNYSKLSDKNIKSYSLFNGSLYTHFEGDLSTGVGLVIKREGSSSGIEGSTAFVITDKFDSPTVVSHNTSVQLNDEALFLTKEGVFGITVSDVTSEKVCVLRSAYLGDLFSHFTKEELNNAHGVIFRNMYLISVGDKIAVLDGERKSYFSGTPLCSFQYECYYLENIPARVSWTDGDTLYFGSEQGIAYCFFKDEKDESSYTDDGKNVSCFYETADISGGTFFKKKTFVSVSAKMGSFKKTGVKIYAQTDGRWHNEPIYNSNGRGRYFTFSHVDFSSVSFSSNKSRVTLCGKIRIRNVDSVRFGFANDESEPFVLLGYGTEYVKKGNFYH